MPINHKTIPHPLNLQDRLEYIKDTFQVSVSSKIVKINKKDPNQYVIHVSFPNTVSVKPDICKKYGLKIENKQWVGVLGMETLMD